MQDIYDRRKLLYEFYFNVDENDNDCIKKGCPVTYYTYIFYLPN